MLELIDGGSGTYAIDGHVTPSASGSNELAAYGAKYRKVGGPQADVMGVHDAVPDGPVPAVSCDGALPDKASVGEVFDRCRLGGAPLLADMGFCSEENLGLLRRNGRAFVVPRPPNTVAGKAAVPESGHEGELAYERRDHGEAHEVTVRYLGRTVSGLEDAWQAVVDERAREKGRRARRVTRSAYGGDRVIVCRDEETRDRLVAEYRPDIGKVKGHTEEGLKELEPTFGVICLRTNREGGAKDSHASCKKRWTIETHYDHVTNGVGFKGIREQDWYVQQGTAFVLLAAGLVHSGLVHSLHASRQGAVSSMTVPDCLAKAKRVKAARHPDDTWHASRTTKAAARMMEELGVDVAGDVARLQSDTFGA